MRGFANLTGGWLFSVALGVCNPALAMPPNPTPTPCATGKLTPTKLYVPSDFGKTDFREKTSPKFNEWAARNANEIAEAYAKGEPMEKIIERLAASRKELAREMGEEPGPFGNRRDIGATTPVGPPSESPSFAIAKAPIQNWIRRIESQEMKTGTMEGRPIEYRDLPYVTRDGKTLNGGRVFRYTDSKFAQWTIDHSEGKASMDILKDALGRLDDLRTPGKVPEAERAEYFARAMAGWYLAMPWDRGSAGAGVSLGAGVAKILGKDKNVLPSDLDILVMTGHSADPSRDLLQAIRPALAGFPNGRALPALPPVVPRVAPGQAAKTSKVTFDDFGDPKAPFIAANFSHGQDYGSTTVQIDAAKKTIQLHGLILDRGSQAKDVAPELIKEVTGRYAGHDVLIDKKQKEMSDALKKLGFVEKSSEGDVVRFTRPPG